MTETPVEPALDAPVRHFDHHSDPDLLASPYEEWARLQQTTPSFLSTAGPRRIWYLTRYDDVRGAAEQPDLFSSGSILPFEADSERPRLIPEEIDPPRHTAYRQLLQAHFSAGEARALEPVAREAAAALVDGIVDAGGCEFINGFARPYSSVVLMHMLGMAPEDRDSFVTWVANLMIARPEDDPDGSIRMGAAMEIYSYLGRLVQERVQNPGEDLLSTMLGQSVEGRPVDPGEVVQIGFQLCMAGLDTLAGVLGFVFEHLAGDAAVRAAVRADTSDTAIDELLRCFAVTAPGRVVTRDTEFGGCPMQAGDRVVLPFAAANRDPSAFPDAQRLDLRRKPNRHLAFGAGPHRCPGAALSRVELRVAIEEWHRRIPDYKVASGAVVTAHVGSVAGLDALPLTWPTS